MTMAIVAERWDASVGGRERYARDLVDYLTEANHTIVLVRPSDGVPQDASCVLALTPHPEATHYQLHGGLLDAAFAAERAALTSAMRRAFHTPALALNRRRQRLRDAEARMLSGQTALMAFSQADADRLLALGIARSRVRLARPGVDLRRFRPDGQDDPAEPDHAPASRRLGLLFVGHNAVLKGLPTAIRAVARARQIGVDATLHVVGRGARARDRRLAAREGLASLVTFAGEVSQDRLAAIYRASDALLHPTFYDPFPRVAVEALASGCAVVTTACCGAAEIVRHGCEGYIVPDPRDVESFAAALVALASRSQRRVRRVATALGQQFDQVAHFRLVEAWLIDPTHAS